MEKLAKVLINGKITIRQAMKQLSESAIQILLVVDNQKKLIGTVTDGDIRRALLSNTNLNASVSKIANKEPKSLYETETESAAEFMSEHSIIQVPVLNRHNQVVDLILWKDVNKSVKTKEYCEKDNMVFILAGGKGTRLDPFTKILPKPLIPINDKPILEIIMENFKKYGFHNFTLSLNYKKEMIKMYFKDNPQNFKISYVEEEEFLGTAGSLHLIKEKAKKTVIVSNCDVILNINFEELLDHHKQEKNDFTVVGIVRHIKIPYGIMKMRKGNLTDIIEKPEYDFLVNTGIYAIEPKIIGMINKGENIDMNVLIMKIKKQGCKVGVYPVSTDWIDIGQWEEYKVALEHLRNAGLA